MEAIDLIYPAKLAVAEKRLPVFERLHLALVVHGQSTPVPRLVSLGLSAEGELLEAQPVYGGELFAMGLSQLICGFGGNSLLVAAGLKEALDPMMVLLDGLALQAFQMVQARKPVADGREKLLEQLRSELFLKVPTAGPLDLLRTEEIVNRCWRELSNHREAFGRLRADLQNDLQQALHRGQMPQWVWRITLLNGRLRVRQVATR